MIVFDNELACSPLGLMDFLHQADSFFLQGGCRGRGIVSIKIEVKVFALIYNLYRRVLLVYALQVKELITRPYARIKVLKLELERQAHFVSVKAY